MFQHDEPIEGKDIFTAKDAYKDDRDYFDPSFVSTTQENYQKEFNKFKTGPIFDTPPWAEENNGELATKFSDLQEELRHTKTLLEHVQKENRDLWYFIKTTIPAGPK